ncbi:MAG: DUF6152 family protein [Pseudomonadota bacterium]
MKKLTSLFVAPVVVLSSLVSISATPFVHAHHSPAAYYLLDQEIDMTGKVTEFRMGNPHARIYLDVTTAAGTTEQWMAEGGSRTVMLRSGWTGDEVNVGDIVTVKGHPPRGETKIMHWVRIELQDGRQLFGEDLNPEVINRKLEERRKRD